MGGEAFGGSGGGVGGAVAGEWLFSSAFSLRAGGSLRTVAVTAAGGPLTTLSFGLGLGWRATLIRSVGISARVDALAMRESITHFDGDEPSAIEEDRWLPAADTFVDGTWAFTEGGSAFLGLGLEVAAGQTDVFSHERLAATIPPARGLLEAGVRVRF